MEGYDYDFDLSIRPDEQFTGSAERAVIEPFLESLPGVGRHGDHFVLDSPIGRWMEIRLETRHWDGKSGERVADAPHERFNCIHLHFPASARGPEVERDYYEAALAIAERLGWTAWDDTDSGSQFDRSRIELWWPAPASRPWWKLW